MTPARLEDVRNFRQVDDRLATGGQPNEAQLAAARAAGVEVVINLALHDDPRYSLPDERGTVEALGMTYRHIPVQFGQPAESDLLSFARDVPSGASASFDHAAAEAALLVSRGEVSAAVHLITTVLTAAPAGATGWRLPIEPLLYVSRRPEWAPALALLRDRAM